MGSFSDYLEDELLDHILGTGAWTPPTTVYLALSKADPTDAGSGLNEPGENYARKTIAFGAAASRSVTQSGTVTFDQATGNWGTITHYALMSAVTSGNMLAHGSLSASKEIVTGNTPSVAASEVVVSFNSGAVFTTYANQILDFAFRNQSLSQPTIYCGLSTTVPDDTGNVTEPGQNYARVAHSAWDASSGGASENTGAITFTQANASWGTITYTFLAAASTAGTLMFYGNVTDQAVGSGDTVEFADGAFDITLS
jgi:hypothetical protein